jgi:aquaporin Z
MRARTSLKKLDQQTGEEAMELSVSDNRSVFDILRQRNGMPETMGPIAPLEMPASWTTRMTDALRHHWPEYLMEGAELGLFMLSACAFTVLLFHPSSPLAQQINNTVFRRFLMGTAMGATAIAIIFSPIGKRTGAHFNPAVTLTFFRLGKLDLWDAFFYVLAQFAGGIAGVLFAAIIFGEFLSHQSVNYATTLPGMSGVLTAFLGELVITFILMTVILNVSNSRRLSRWAGVFAGALVAAYITFEAPISGMSMNPARSLGSAVGAQVWTSLWIYFTAPPIGMLLAAEVYQLLRSGRGVVCAKLHHHNNQRCIFKCNFKA